MNRTAPHDPALEALLVSQRAYFEAGHTLPIAFRKEQLRRFRDAVKANEGAIVAALKEDLGRCELESRALDVSMLLIELDHALKGVTRWAAPKRTVSPMVAQPSRSVVYAQPVGTNLILGAWNYPVQLSLQPLVGAIAAGCVAVVKPSEISVASSAVVAKIIRDTFAPEYVAVVEGGVEVSQALLALEWDHIFYTGGTRVGQVVAHAAADHLSRVTLELGGKSPVIIGASANLDTAARRVAWGKWINAGQTCIAPDYVLVHESVHDVFLDKLKAFVRTMYGEDPRQSPDFARIVNERHTRRLEALIQPEKVVMGGQVDVEARYVAPTVMTGVTWEDPAMQEEIFGPVLPVRKISSVSDAVAEVRHAPNPLALYLFTEDDRERDLVINRISFGGGCVNNTGFHLSDPSLPFGGIRSSGQGAYHGKHSFDRFTHFKSVLESNSSSLFDLSIRYPPYAGKLDKLLWLIP